MDCPFLAGSRTQLLAVSRGSSAAWRQAGALGRCRLAAVGKDSGTMEVGKIAFVVKQSWQRRTPGETYHGNE
jgi:hypothetical protein